MPSIATISMSPSLDVFAEMEQLQPDRKLRAESQRMYPGGGGINVARAIDRLGGGAFTVFPAGGSGGDRISTLLADEGVPHTRVPAMAPLRENFLLHVRDANAMYHFVLPGSPVTPEEAERCLNVLAGLRPEPDYLVVSGSLPPGLDHEFYLRVARLAQGRNTRLVLDAPGSVLASLASEPIYLIKPNEYEFAELTGEPPADDTRECIAQAKAFLQRSGVTVMVLSMGSRGALLVAPDQQIRVRPPMVEGVSSVGAGDSFVGAMILGLARGASLKEALCAGSAASAAVVETGGTELFHRDAMDRIYSQILRDPEAVEVHEIN